MADVTEEGTRAFCGLVLAQIRGEPFDASDRARVDEGLVLIVDDAWINLVGGELNSGIHAAVEGGGRLQLTRKGEVLLQALLAKEAR